MLPHFVVIGAMKSGTTSLHEYLRTHPMVFMPAVKETHFFDATQGNWHRGLAWYESQFRGASPGDVVGEASPGYTRHPAVPGVAGRLASVLPAARLIYLVRHPIDRMRSQYQQNALYEGERQPIDEALLGNPHYADCSRYAMQLDQYLEHFPPEQILVITSEALRTRRRDALVQVFEFIGVHAEWMPPNLDQEAHQSIETRSRGAVGRLVRRVPGHGRLADAVPEKVLTLWRRAATRPVAPDAFAISDDTRRRLEEQLAPDVARLRRFLGNDFDGWGIG